MRKLTSSRDKKLHSKSRETAPDSIRSGNHVVYRAFSSPEQPSFASLVKLRKLGYLVLPKKYGSWWYVYTFPSYRK